MATQPTKMNIIKQVLTGHKNGLSVRKMADMYSISPTTVQRYLKMASEDPLGIDALLRLEDPELNHRFNGGNPAYCDRRFEDFKTRIAYFEQELKKPNMTTYRKHSKKYTFYTLRFGCSFAAVNTIKPQLL